MPPWRDRKSMCVILILVLTFYTFSFCVLYVSKHLVNPQLQYSDSVLDIDNESRHLSDNGPVWKETASKTLSMYIQKDKAMNSRNASHQTKLGSKYVVHYTEKQPQSPYAQHINATNHLQDNVSYFRSRLQGEYAVLLYKTIRVFDSVMTENHIAYMIYGGTLIGSYRHHGLVPWDDDVDALVPLTAKDSLQQAFSQISHEYTLNTDSETCWKLFSVLSDKIHGCGWGWPYLDIFFFAENQTHIWDVSPKYIYEFCYPKTIIFPLRRRPFMNLTLLAPHNSRAVIDTNYDIGLCKSGAWIHRWEREGHEVTVPCSRLFSKFAFVQRVFINGGCNETLVQNGEIFSNYFDEGKNC